MVGITRLNAESIRALLLEAILEARKDQHDVCRSLVELAMAKKILERKNAASPYLARGDPSEYVDENLVFEDIWNFYRQGLLRPDFRAGQPLSLHKVVITSHGEHCRQEKRISVHDPQGYLADLQQRCGTLDEEVKVLTRESLLTFQANCYVASTILIGAASERLIQVLFESYRDAHQKQSDHVRLDKEWDNKKRRSIAQKFEWLWQKLKTRSPDLNKAGGLWDGAEGWGRSTFDVLRTARNEAVHQGRHFEQIQAYEHLCQFATYSERIYKLINFFRSVRY